MQKIILTKGLPASGKSTWAKQYVKDNPKFKRINNDDIREMLDCGVPYSKENENFVSNVRETLTDLALKNGFSVIIDNTNLNPYHIKQVFKKYENRFEIIIKDFTDITVNECIKRDYKRPKPVGAEVIIDMYERYIKKS